MIRNNRRQHSHWFRYALFSFALVLIGSFASANSALASNGYHWVNVCNRGDVDLRYLVLASRSNLGQGDRARLLGWKEISKGQCENVTPLNYQAVTIAFVHEGASGEFVNPVYSMDGAEPAGDNKYAPPLLCAPESGTVNYKGTLSAVKQRATPPCASGYYPVVASFYIKPGARVPKLIAKPSGSSSLPVWPAVRRAVAPAPAKAAAPPAPSAAKPAAKPLIPLQNLPGLNRRISDYTLGCQRSILTAVFKAYNVDRASGCGCMAKQLAERQDIDVLRKIDDRLDTRQFQLAGDSAGKKNLGFEAVLKNFVDENYIAAYIRQCTVKR